MRYAAYKTLTRSTNAGGYFCYAVCIEEVSIHRVTNRKQLVANVSGQEAATLVARINAGLPTEYDDAITQALLEWETA